MVSLEQPAVAVDGDALRRIREQKRLTQLYVSKVVGVTTDTVSRWENNRYPTIRRENAVKLAEALEVELNDILKQEPVAGAAEELDPAQKGWFKWFWPVVAVAALLAGWLLFYSSKPPVDAALRGDRFLPPHIAPGHQLPVHLVIDADRPVKGVVLKETLASGLKLIAAEPQASSIDSSGAVVRWIFRNPDFPIHVHYLVEVSTQMPLNGNLLISGEVIANPEGRQFSMDVASTNRVSVQPLHWVDTNGDLMIDDLEILIFSEQLERSPDLDQEWRLVEQIWHAGGYRWVDGTFSVDSRPSAQTPGSEDGSGR